jgi:hypothetical protein
LRICARSATSQSLCPKSPLMRGRGMQLDELVIFVVGRQSTVLVAGPPRLRRRFAGANDLGD